MPCFKFLKKKNTYKFEHPYYEKGAGGRYNSGKADNDRPNVTGTDNMTSNKQRVSVSSSDSSSSQPSIGGSLEHEKTIQVDEVSDRSNRSEGEPDVQTTTTTIMTTTTHVYQEDTNVTSVTAVTEEQGTAGEDDVSSETSSSSSDDSSHLQDNNDVTTEMDVDNSVIPAVETMEEEETQSVSSQSSHHSDHVSADDENIRNEMIESGLAIEQIDLVTAEEDYVSEDAGVFEEREEHANMF